MVLVHGFPESWYSWRHQMGPIAAAGFTACAIDVRGYGGSGKPADIAAYDMEHMVGDVAALIEHLTPGEKAVLVGHDWGAHRLEFGPDPPRQGPRRGRPVGALYRRAAGELHGPGGQGVHAARQVLLPGLVPGRGAARGRAGGRSAHEHSQVLLRHQRRRPGRDLAQRQGPRPEPARRAGGPRSLPAWLTEADLDYYAAEFAGSGFFGPLSRYRNHQRDFEYLSKFEGRKIEQPSLFIGGSATWCCPCWAAATCWRSWARR
uniref:Alpha/beta fold hydrolase n=1 Tax=Phenylobacterium glaciei TaxID=2803784 RepID=A0A974P5K8_9CAUL|nr:alpha/beta fold hydrolase [Phenylobacterium glaciei]